MPLTQAVVASHVGKGHDRIYFSLMWAENSYIIMHKYKQLHHTLSKRSQILDISISSYMWHWKIIWSKYELSNNKEASQLFTCDTAFLGFNFRQHFQPMVDVLDGTFPWSSSSPRRLQYPSPARFCLRALFSLQYTASVQPTCVQWDWYLHCLRGYVTSWSPCSSR